MKKVVITGGPYSGKTTIVDYFSKLRFKVLSEVPLEVIKNLNKKLGVEEQKKWRKKNIKDFQIDLAKKQVKREKLLKSKKDEIVFLDRGLHDTLAYCVLYNVVPPKKILALAKKHKYDFVFLLETLSPFKQRSETGRISNKKTSIKIGNLIEKKYKDYGIKVIRVKEMSVKKRGDFIFNIIKKI